MSSHRSPRRPSGTSDEPPRRPLGGGSSHQRRSDFTGGSASLASEPSGNFSISTNTYDEHSSSNNNNGINGMNNMRRSRSRDRSSGSYHRKPSVTEYSTHSSPGNAYFGRRPQRREEPVDDDGAEEDSLSGRRPSLTSNLDDETSSILRQMVETQNALAHNLQTGSEDEDDMMGGGGPGSYHSRTGSYHSRTNNSVRSRSNSIHSKGPDLAALPTMNMPSMSPTIASDDQLQQLSMQNQALMEHIKQLQDNMPGAAPPPPALRASVSAPHTSPRGAPNSPYGPPKSPRNDGFALVPPPPLGDAASVGSNHSRSKPNTFQVPLSAPQGRRPTFGSTLRGPQRTSSLVDNMDTPLSAPQGARRKFNPANFGSDSAPRRVQSLHGRSVDPPFVAPPPMADMDRTVRSVPAVARRQASLGPPLNRSLHGRSMHSRGSNHEPARKMSLHSRRSAAADDADGMSQHIPQSIVVNAENNGTTPADGAMYDDRSLLSGDDSRGSSLLSRHDRSLAAARGGTYHPRQSGMTVATAQSENVNETPPVPQRQRYADPIDDYEPVDNPPGSRFWKSLSVAMTCLIPDCLIPKKSAGEKLAWREKVTICLIVFFVSIAIVGGIGFLPIFLCRSSEMYTQAEINKQSGEAWITAFGTIYDVKRYIGKHPGGAEGFRNYLGQDVSRFFPRPPPSALPAFCLDISKNSSLVEDLSCPGLEDEEDSLSETFCHTNIVGREGVHNLLRGYKEGEFVVSPWDLDEDENMNYLLIDKTIYDVTQYIDGLRDEKTKVFSTEPSHPNAYLFEDLHRLIVNWVDSDATAAYDAAFQTNDFKNCMDMMFYHARVDDRYDAVCSNIGVAMYFLLFVVTFMMLIQVFCSLLYLARSHPHFTEEDKKAAVMIMVPCYNETDKELLKTIDSVLLNDYPEENKVLTVVADGVITGSGATASTPEILGDILGFEFDCMDEAHEYKSLGESTRNYISVYAGVYEKKIGNGTRRLKYMVLVKQGSMAERGTRRAGNRGKRDSQLAIAGMLNRLHYNREPGELDNVVKRELDRLDIPLKDIEYMMAIDADTRVHRMAMQHMVYHLERNKTVLACCGETQVDNKSQSWVTMMQVFEYFSSHHMKKAFESVFGCVTCLPGCFTMYRLFTEDMNPLISADIIFQEYSRNDIESLHEKNLYELGEDRMLTTLLLQHFPGMKLSFVPEAICWTIVPHTFSILLSQRRRWINSTLHNMFELLKVETMCGICCISMKTIVIADLLATMILPASIAYLGYLGYLFATQPETIDTFVLYFYAVTIILMMLPFLIRSRWDYFFWFIMYVMFGIPTFYFILPLYSFVHMDDFSWGKTRMVSGGDAPTPPPAVVKDGKNPEKEDTTDKQSSTDGEEKSLKDDKSTDDEKASKDSKTVKDDATAKDELSTRDGRTVKGDVSVRGDKPAKGDRSVRGNSSVRGGKSVKEDASILDRGDASVHSRRSTRSSGTARSGGTARRGRTVQAITTGTDSGEILVYFQSTHSEKQPFLAPLVKALEESEELRLEYNIDAILTRPNPTDHTIPLRADPSDPDEDEVWFVLVRRIRSLRENSRAFRKTYAEWLCLLFADLSARHKKKSFAFRYGKDITPEDGTGPLGDYITTSDAIAYIQDVNANMALESLALDQDTLSLYFGEDRLGEAKNAVLEEMFAQAQEEDDDDEDSVEVDSYDSGSDQDRWDERRGQPGNQSRRRY